MDGPTVGYGYKVWSDSRGPPAYLQVRSTLRVLLIINAAV
jgi:hypothetical protein